MILLSPPGAGGEELGATLRDDLGYLGHTVWEDGKTIARAPLEIGRITDVTPEQLLIGALAVGSVGGMIALDRTIRERAKNVDDGSALALQYAGFSLVSGGLIALYGAGLSTDNEQMRHAALSGLESTVVAWGVAQLMKVGFGRERPDANKGPYAWFQGGRSFVSADTAPAFALAEAVAAGFDHRWEVTLPAYVAPRPLASVAWDGTATGPRTFWLPHSLGSARRSSSTTCTAGVKRLLCRSACPRCWRRASSAFACTCSTRTSRRDRTPHTP
jgi:hypothetical protein